MSDASDIDEADRLLAFYVIRRTQLRALLAAPAGDVRTAQVRPGVLAMIASFEQVLRRNSMACGSCLRPIKHRSAYRIGVVVPDTDLPRWGKGFALCRCCSGTNAATYEAGIKASQNIYPDRTFGRS